MGKARDEQTDVGRMINVHAKCSDRFSTIAAQLDSKSWER